MQLTQEEKKQIITQIKEMMQSSTQAIIEKIDHVTASGMLSETDIVETTKNQSHVFAKLLITAYFNDQPYAPPTHNKVLKKILKQFEYAI